MPKETLSVIPFETITFRNDVNELVIIDQTKLPGRLVYRSLKSSQEVWHAIHQLQVRGAPAIGIAAAYGIYLAVSQITDNGVEDFKDRFQRERKYLSTSRPTAVNLFWALDRMSACLEKHRDKSVVEIREKLREEADAIKEEDVKVCRRIGEYGLTLTKPGMGLLTHCNAGQLATARYGTALAPMYLGQEQGYQFRVFADETRPLLQGARLTAFELQQAGIDVTLICDNMVSMVMKNKWVQAVFTGGDRVAANGDAANKIGTSGVAILAKHYGIPFYICAPTATIDMQCDTGTCIPIEERPPEEVTRMWYREPMAPEGIKVYNPAFDVTEASLITAIVTEYGIARPPYSESLKSIFQRKADEGGRRL